MMPLRELGLLPGDILLSNSRTRASLWIKIVQLLRSPDQRSDVSHAAVCMGYLLTPGAVVESLLTVRETPLTKYEGGEVVIWRRRGLTERERFNIAVAAQSQIGSWYAPAKLALFALDALTGLDWSGYFGWQSFAVCSGMVAWAIEYALGPKDAFGRPWHTLTPSDIDSFCLANQHEWELVYSSIKGRET